MKTFTFYLLAASFLTAQMLLISCGKRSQREKNSSSTLKNNPAKHNADSSLQRDSGEPADNGRCYVCHLNYADEEITVVHSNAGIGCEKCHGPCYAHCNDESNTTPPDIMYSKEDVNPFCMSCHPAEKLKAEPHINIFKASTHIRQICTDCHGNHRLGRRTQYSRK